MTGRNRLIVLIIIIFSFGCLSAADKTNAEENTPRPVDEMYDRTVTEGLAMRYPGENRIPEEERERIRETGKVERSAVLDAAFSALEEGNPFTERYNIITGSDIRPLMAYGIPYFYGGRSMEKVLENAPNYRTLEAWQNSPIYYRKYTKYFLGLDCRGLIEYVWHESGTAKYTISRYSYEDAADRKIISGTGSGRMQMRRRMFRGKLKVGDVIAVYHPGVHTMIYIGKLSDYGYTEKDFPQDPSILSYPLVIHCGVNAVYADWFYHVKELYPIFRNTSVPDGGVTVSVLGYENPAVTRTIVQQKQETAWVQMPDDTWLTVIRWSNVDSWSVYR